MAGRTRQISLEQINIEKESAGSRKLEGVKRLLGGVIE